LFTSYFTGYALHRSEETKFGSVGNISGATQKIIGSSIPTNPDQFGIINAREMYLGM
jgi:hypothetical protein